MHAHIQDFYRLPDIDKYEDLDLLALSESCAVLEEEVYAIAANLPDRQRKTIESYILARNDLEVETCKAAMRWGKRNLLHSGK